MTRRLPILFLLLSALLAASGASARLNEVNADTLAPSKDQRHSALVMTRVIERYHYKKAELDDAFSERILERYLETLDPNRSFLLAADVETFGAYRHHLDEALKSGNIEPAYNIFRIYRQRVETTIARALAMLELKFDFNRDESYQFDRSKAPWPANRAARDELWRKRIKNDLLGLKLSGKPDAEARELLHKRYAGIARRVKQFDSEDVFQTFVNAYTLSLEPHTGYMSPSTSENFDISMRLSLEGIGAVLASDNEYTVVQKTVPGGPAKLSGQIKSGDRIIGVAQGTDGEMEDVVGWRLQDVVEKIRGPKGSVVRLRIIPKRDGSDAPGREVILVRNQIKLEEQAAKRSIIEGLDGMGALRIGVIEVPTFYRDFRGESRGEDDFRSTTRDVRRLIDELRQQGIDGLVVDLRSNGGGSLSEATELVGLFIDQGPVVQVKDAFGKVEVERDDDPGVAYEGPLAVLIDRNSASASEIFAGAIQDYRRGILIGEPSFGKGTVQTLIDLNRFVPGNEGDFGRLRLTMAQFFRVSGSSTQNRGVVPDIVFPTAKFAAEHGERSIDNALPWDQISPAKFETVGAGAFSHLLARHRQRVANDPGFELLESDEQLIQQESERKEISLLESRRESEWEAREAQRRARENRFRQSLGLPPLAEPADQENGDDEQAEENLVTNIQLREAARILADDILQRGLRPIMTSVTP